MNCDGFEMQFEFIEKLVQNADKKESWELWIPDTERTNLEQESGRFKSSTQQA